MKKQLLILLLLCLGTVNTFSQLRTVGTESERNAEYKKAIGLDTTVPDFDTKKIDAEVMGSRLANLLSYLLENYNQESYELQIVQILGEQNESLQHLYYKIKKMQFAHASKQGDVMTVTMHVWPDKNIADVNQVDMIFRFVDGVSDDRTTNVLFSYMSRYVDAQEVLKLQDGGTPENSKAIVTNSFWDNWYGQIGVDMSLQNPYGCNFAHAIPNGMTFGIDIAVGKWLVPEYGIRGKVNLENAIIKNNQASWVHTKKGYLIFTGDIQLSLKYLLGEYMPNEKWNMYVYPRAGAFIDLRDGNGAEGSPLLGLGFGGTYRLNSKWSIYGDVAYQVVSSVIGEWTGQGGGKSNGYFDINLGVQLDLGYNCFDRVSKKPVRYKHAVIKNGFWDNWFLQAGLGMSLMNPYGSNFFKNVFPNGKSFGINLGIGKWMTPVFGLRGGFNWQNGIVGGHYQTWLDVYGEEASSHKKGGYVAAYADAFFNLHGIIGGYDESRLWNAIIYPRAGIDHNFLTSGSSPLLGIGTEHTFRINDRMKIYADVAYQVTSGDFLDADTGLGGSTGWFDINVGVQYELGQIVGWNKTGENRTTVVDTSGHNWPRFIFNTSTSVVVAFGAKTVLKAVVKEERPDHSDNKSFPSGHASMAFAAARSIDKEFRKDCIWIPIAGYAAATAIGVERVVNKHHHWYDVLAGAGIGIGSAELTWWLSDLMFGKGRNVAVGSSGNTVDVVYNF